MNFRNRLFALLPILITTSLMAQTSGPLEDRHVTAQVIGESTHIQPGQPYRLGLLLEHAPGWHTYWKSTATGYATSIEWVLPDGFSVSDLHWPVPKAYNFEGWTEYVYEGRTLLMATLTPSASFDGDNVEIGFTADWLMCEAVCIPGGVSGSIVVPVRDTPVQPSDEWQADFQHADTQLPHTTDAFTLEAFALPEGVRLRVTGDLPESLYFFDDQRVIKAQPEQEIRNLSATSREVILPLDDAVDQVPERLSGVLKAETGWPGTDGRPALVVDLPVLPDTTQTTSGGAELTFGILLLALAGGLILNLMPCVFPVLGIKIMGFVSQAGSSRGKIVSHGLVFTAGVLVSFWILAAALLILRSGGSQLGWGFQLQSPAFVLSLTLLLFAFGLNMAGLFEFGQSAVGVGSGLTAKSGFSGSFFSGVLATVVATPCAAPFLAPALGAALTLPPLSSFLVFSVIGIGLSMPYLILSAFPALVQRLPRPGPWMETFKQFMSFLLFATVAFLLWVLAGQLTEATGHSPFSFLRILLSLVVAAFALWIFGRWGAFHRPKRTRYVATALSILILGGGFLTGYTGTRPSIPSDVPVTWEKWEPGKAETLAEGGSIVYVDFTARWCVTCQTNKAAVFTSREVREHFAEGRAVALKADWTNQDPAISAALAEYGRSAVPFNLVYGPGLPEPIILPELLTPGIVLAAIEEAKGS